MGATAIGTGLNAPAGYAEKCTEHLKQITGFPIHLAPDLIEATQDTQAFVLYSSCMKSLAIKLSKVCNDLRLLSSGPRCGLREINLPAKQPGSSIMPGKVNPVIPEVVNMVCFRVIGSDMTVTMAAEAGQLQLNVFEPVIAACIFEAQTMFINAMRTLRVHCVEGITANPDVVQHYVDYSIGTVTALNPVIGYDKVHGARRGGHEDRQGHHGAGAREEGADREADRRGAESGRHDRPASVLIGGLRESDHRVVVAGVVVALGAQQTTPPPRPTTPPVQGPQPAVPTVQTPKTSVPEVHKPQVTTPEVHVPQTTAPTVAAPQQMMQTSQLFEGTWSASGQRQILQTEPGRSAVTVHLSGAVTITTGAGLSRGFRGEVIGFDDGAGLIAGRVVWTDERGDRIFSSLNGDALTATGRHMRGTITGGTGRYAGFTGDYEFRWQNLIATEGNHINGRTVDLRGRVFSGGAR